MPDQTNPSNEKTAAELGEQVKEVGAKMVDAAREKMRSGFEKQQRRAADEISGVAGALRDAADRLHAEDHGGTAHYVKAAADQAAKLAGQVRDRGLEDLVAKAEGIARRQPELFVGGALLAGVVLGRFLKASSNRRRMAGDIDLATRSRPAATAAERTPPSSEPQTSVSFDYAAATSIPSGTRSIP